MLHLGSSLTILLLLLLFSRLRFWLRNEKTLKSLNAERSQKIKIIWILDGPFCLQQIFAMFYVSKGLSGFILHGLMYINCTPTICYDLFRLQHSLAASLYISMICVLFFKIKIFKTILHFALLITNYFTFCRWTMLGGPQTSILCW